MSSKAIGIDLGTTNSCVAIFEYGCVEIIADDKGNRTTPSYVAFTNDGLFIGHTAKNWETTDPSKVISSTKRLIGRKFDDDAFQENINQFPFKIIQENSKLKIEVEYGDMTVNFLPEQISAMILSELKDITEKYLGTKVTDAVITVPAYFNNAQREATCDAAKIAGLNVLRLINEPTAAAIAYGFEKREEMNVLVFDLGSGTFDVSVLSTDNGVFEVKSTGGNTNLGGNDFDIRLVQHCIDEFERKYSKNITSDKNAYRKLQISCEHAKCQLSFNSDALIDIENLYDGFDFHVKISRSKFEDLCEDLFYLTIKSVEKAITDSYLEKNEIDKVILVGGSSRIPFIQRLICEFFDGIELCDSINPDQAVAYGAAVQAAILSGIEPEIMQDLLLIDVTPISLGLEEFGGLMAVLVKANTPIPINITEVFTTTTDNQNRLRFKVYEGENKMARSNHLLGEFVLENIRPASRGVPQIDVTFGLDENGILNVTAVDRETGNTNHITISNDSGRLTKDEICQMRQQAEIMHEADSKEYSRISARTMLDNYIYQIQSMLQTSNFECDSKITSNVGQIKEWLQENKSANESEFNEKLNELRRFIN